MKRSATQCPRHPVADQNHRDLIDPSLALNEGGGVDLKNGKAINSVQTSEKISTAYQLSQTAAATRRCRAGQHDLSLAEMVRCQIRLPDESQRDHADLFARPPDRATERRRIRAILAPQRSGGAGALSGFSYNAQLHTTCVATMLHGGHA